MKRSSINTIISLSTNTKTTYLETYIKTSLTKNKSLKNKTPNIFNTSKKNSQNDYSLSKDSISFSSDEENSLNNSKMELSKVSSINKHKKISKLPYYLKNKEDSKLKYINKYIKTKKLPKYSSDSLGIKLKNDINFPNLKIFSKKKKRNMDLSAQKKLNRKCFYLNRDNSYISFGLYFDRDIIDNSKELNKELIEADNDMDCDSDDENINSGINTCLFDIKNAILEVKKNINSIYYIKKNKTYFFS